MQKLNTLCLTTLLVLASCGPSGSNNGKKNKTALVPTSEVNTGKLTADTDSIAKSLQTEMRRMDQHPSLTIVMMPKGDVQSSITKLTVGGGKLVYDPNNGFGSTIPFYIAELTPALVNDSSFLGSLNLKAATVDRGAESISPIETKITSKDLDFTNFIPTDSVALSDLGDTKTLGKGITVAVIDTGVDASHPAFGNRVSYWYDATEETKTELKKVEANNNSIELTVGETTKKILLPEFLPQGEIYAGIMSEKAFITQLDKEQREHGYLDLNENKSDDNYLVVAVKTDKGIKIYFDDSGDLKLSSITEKKEKINYNDTTKSNRSKGMVSFPTRNNILSYPVILERDADKIFVTLGKTSGMHGTHVAGIVAANDKDNNLLGAAPEADIMSLKVCSGISCTDSAIIKGLYKAFYNGKVIPDVVNISLGSHEKYARDVYSHVLNDLSAKFGAIFFISASNSGPGFRSLNHFGNSGAVVMVGANVSSKTLRDQYNLSTSVSTQTENLLFFSSLGPSYTGEMKPNIVAPGAAISATPASSGYMGQANGTSMSSPLAAGAFASVLSVLKESTPAYFETIKKVRAANKKGKTITKKTLLPYVFAMRDALQNGAKEQDQLTRAQQGYGLLQAGTTKSLLASYLSALNSGERDYFEVAINNFKRGYDRSGKLKDVQSYKLSLAQDGERTKESLAKIIARGVDVKLARVEVLDTNGDVQVLTDSDKLRYFSIVDRGNETNKLVTTHVTFNNRRTYDFHSKRYLAEMTTGKTYIAHYVIESKGVIVNNILDVVHMPFKLKESKVSVPSIDPKIKKTKSGFAKANVEIKTNVFHRYPIYVDKATHKLMVNVALAAESEGRLYVQLYDPSGKEVEFKVAQNSSITPYKAGEIEVSTFKDGKVKEGIWELTVATASSTWLSNAKYDLLVQSSKFGAKKKNAIIAAGVETIIPVQTDGHPITEVLITSMKQVHKQKVETKSSHVSFQKLVLPEGYTGLVELNVVDEKDSYWGKVVPKLFVKKDDKFVAYSGSYFMKGEAIALLAALDEDVYFALDTFTNYSDAVFESSVSSSVVVETIFKLAESVKIEATFENVNSMNISLVKVMLKEMKLKGLNGENAHLEGDLLIISGKVEELISASGDRIINVDSKSLVNKVKLKI